MGGLIGLERERRLESGAKDRDFAGIRTMSLVAIFGYIAAYFFESNMVLFSVFTGGFMLLLVAAYLKVAEIHKRTGATTEIAAILAFILGVLMAMDFTLEATVLALLVILILHFKKALHDFAHCINKEELYDTFKFIAIAFVILPLLPNEQFGPMEVFNPYSIWLVVVLISSISFASYVAIKFLGPKKGVAAGGFLGGLLSSTAVSMSMSELSKKSKRIANPFVFGIMIASSAMFFRVLAEVAVLDPQLLDFLLMPMVAMGIAGLTVSLVIWFFDKECKNKKLDEKHLKLSSPFQLKPALKFGLFFAALLYVSKFATAYFGDQGLYITAFVSGFMDVDAITVSVAELTSNDELSRTVGSVAIVIAAMTNTLTKGVIALAFASRKVGVRTLSAMMFVLLVGVFTLSI